MRVSVRTILVGLTAAAVGVGLVAAPPLAGASSHSTSGSTATGTAQDYVVLFKDGAGVAAARAAIARAGGRVVRENVKIGYAVARSADRAFADRVAQQPALDGAARDQPIGYAPKAGRTPRDAVERLSAQRRTAHDGSSTAVRPAGIRAEPLADRQWDMRQIGATPGGSYRVQRGDRRVLVGVIDTGIDGTHPDIVDNFDARLSRNFTTDIPALDGPCEFPSCKDPANWDDDGHGTHVASTIAAPINGRGIAGVAPNVTLVNLRAGQDAGFFFLPATLDALTYAGDIGVDVVNMSFYTDPWLFNCLDNPADSPSQQREQRTIRVATQRAMAYAINHGVAPIAASGNESTDLGHPDSDDTSPDYPLGTAHPRTVDNSCITVPGETNGVTVVNATGPSNRKAYYSNYGLEQSDVAAPGGDAYDSPGNSVDPRNEVLAAYPTRLARINGDIDANGNPTSDMAVKDCSGGSCAYYQYLQGTSMAAPHAVGVAALIVSEHGHADPAHPGGWTLAPATTRSILLNSAAGQACPQPRLFRYTLAGGTPAHVSAYCAGPPGNNGFYGRGIVNAFAAVR